jgi:hypothetical protein
VTLEGEVRLARIVMDKATATARLAHTTATTIALTVVAIDSVLVTVVTIVTF